MPKHKLPKPDAPGTLNEGEFHPAAGDAMVYIKSLPATKLMLWHEAFASTAIEGNRLSEVSVETLRRILDDEPVSDRYLLGLAWTLRAMKSR